MKDFQEKRDENNNLTGYFRASDGANIPVDGDNKDYQKYLDWVSQGNSPSTDSNVLNKIKRGKVEEYKTEAIRRIGLQVPEWGNFETIKFLASFWNLLDKKSLTTNQSNAVSIYTYAKNTAIENVEAQTSISAIQALDVTQGWPV